MNNTIKFEFICITFFTLHIVQTATQKMHISMLQLGSFWLLVRYEYVKVISVDQ